MCNPAIAMMAVTLAMGAAQAGAQRAEGAYEAAVAKDNQKLANAQAEQANAIGAREMEQQSWRTRALIGQQRAAIAANNLDPTLGTPLDILGETAAFGEIDQQNIRLNAAQEAWGRKVEATNYGNAAAMAKWKGNTSANLTILGSLGKAFSQGAGSFGGGGGASSGPMWTASKTGGNIKGGY